MEIVLRCMRGESVDTLSREIGIAASQIEEWHQAATKGMEELLKSRVGDPLEAELDLAKKWIGELSMENELLRERRRRKRSFSWREVEIMSQTISPKVNRPYGHQKVCQVWGISRSTYYSKQKRLKKEESKKRGPKPKICDEELLELIRKDIAASPFKGEGHRKVHARLKRQKAKMTIVRNR